MKTKLSTKKIIERFSVPVILVLVILLLQIFNPEKGILSYSNISLILLQASILGMVSLGLATVMIVGETDMSIAGVVGLIGATFAILLAKGFNPLAALGVSAAVGLVIGILESLLITKVRISSFVITVVFMFIARGIEKLYNDGSTIWLTETIASISTIKFAGVYLFGWLFLALYIIWYIVIEHTKLGFQMRVTGENAQAAREVGIHTGTVKVIAYIFAAIFYIIGSNMEVIRNSGAIIYAGDTYLLPAMAACYMGSTMFTPGHVNVFGTFVGALFMSLVANFLTLLGVAYYVVPLTQGVLLLCSVIFANINNRQIRQDQI